MFMGFLIKSEPWVFVHASYKHDSHALISKFLWFIKNLIIVLSSWEIGDFVKLAKLTLVSVIDRLSDYNLFYICCVVQLINIRIFWELGFSNLGIF